MESQVPPSGPSAGIGSGSAAGPEGFTIASRHGDARVLIDRAGAGARAFLMVLTHGAAGGVETPDLVAVRDAVLGLGGTVARVVQPYRVRGGRAPGSAVRQDEAWADVVAALRRGYGGTGVPLLQGGRSNGARLACRTARVTRADAVIALAFPLHPPGRPERSRRAELVAAGVPVLAVSGERDPFGIPRAEDAEQLVVLAAEGHALARNPAAVGAAVSSWLRQWLSRSR